MINRSDRTFSIKHVLIASVFLCTLICGVTTKSNAQAYFHLQAESQNPASPRYNYFLSLEADGTASLRIAYTKNDNQVLAEILMADSVASDTNRFLIPKTTPRLLRGSADDSLWLPVIGFESRTDSSGLYYQPTSVLFTRNGNTQQGVLQQAEQKTIEALMNEKPLVLQFFSMNEPFYLLLSGFSTRSLTTNEANRKFYLLIIANTNDPVIGNTSQKDVTGIYELFSTLTKQTGITLVPVLVSGDAFTIGNTQKVIDTIRPASNDIIFFYYTGHGFRYANDESKYPRISFRTNRTQVRAINNLAVEDIYKRLLAKRANVTIVISDCCNEKLDASVPFGMDLLRPRATGTAGMKLNFDQFRKLFLPAQPTSIIIGSAAANQLAVGNPNMGGFFTNFFRAELVKSLYSNTGGNSWLRISLNATESTRQQSLTALCNSTPNVQGRCLQRAEVKVLPPL